MLKKTTNPEMPAAPRTRAFNVRGLVEGEDFSVACPEWCDPVADGAWPTEAGWYLAVSLIQSFAEKPPEVDVVWLEWQSWAQEKNGDGWIVNEIGSSSCAERRDFHWVGKIKMPATLTATEIAERAS